MGKKERLSNGSDIDHVQTTTIQTKKRKHIMQRTFVWYTKIPQIILETEKHIQEKQIKNQRKRVALHPDMPFYTFCLQKMRCHNCGLKGHKSEHCTLEQTVAEEKEVEKKEKFIETQKEEKTEN